MKILGRIAVVVALLFIVFMVAARGLMRDQPPGTVFSVTVSLPETGEKAPSWRYKVTQSGVVSVSEHEQTDDEGQVTDFEAVLARVEKDASHRAVFSGTVHDQGRPKEVWKFSAADAQAGEITFMASDNVPASTRQMSVEEFKTLLRTASQLGSLKRTTAARIEDVYNLPSPTLTKVSFPQMSYEDVLKLTGRNAQPVIGDDVPVLKIAKFGEAPSLRDKSLLPPEVMSVGLQGEIPDNLPPVAERLPLNPAVVRGCEEENNGIGIYGGTWRRATASVSDIESKIGYESFIRFDPAGKVQPGLAYKWKIEDDFKTYTFYLRKGHRWSNGELFTAHDVVWVCNDVMESAYWGDMDPWMQKRDGSGMIYVDDIKDWAVFTAMLLEKGRTDTPSVARQVWLKLVERRAEAQQEEEKLLAKNGQKRLTADEHRQNAEKYFEEMVGRAATSPADQEALVIALNGLSTLRDFYNEAAWKNVDLQGDIKAYEDRGLSRLGKWELWAYSVLLERNDLLRRMSEFGIREAGEDVGEGIDSGGDLIRMNTMLLRAGLRDCIVAPYFERVTVETVADETGDDSHIVRFRFKRPHSFFLEQTGTFMFYRGVFQMSRAYQGPLHPSGSKILNDIDILEWPEFLRALADEGQGGKPLPGGRVWALMSEEMKKAVLENKDKDEASYPAAFKQQLVDELNRVLTHRDFYQAEAWAAVDLQAEAGKLLEKGFTMLRDVAERNRVLQIRQRDDLLKRGVNDLSEEELYQFNQAMLRAGFGVGRGGSYVDKPLVASNREKALNVAAMRHPRQFSGWIARMRGLKIPTNDRIEHVPTLRAWRLAYESQFFAVAIRNPYYYRVDIEGNQLPYLDAVQSEKITEKNNVINAMISGNIDAQWRNLEFSDFTVLKMGEAKGNYEIRLWPHDYVGELTFIPVQYSKDPGYAALQAQPAFRHALSMALNRQEMIDVVYSGIGQPAQWSIPPGSPYFNKKHHTISVDYDPRRAEKILDELGLDKRDATGMRTYADGRPFIMEVSVTTDQKHVFDAVQMACNYWQAVGINAQMRQSAATALTRWAELGKLDMRIHKEGGNFFGPVLPGGFMPSNPAECPQWPEWTAWMRSGGRIGKEPPDRIKMLDNMFEKVMVATTEEQKIVAWQKLCDYTADQLPIIGIMTSPGKVVYVHNNFKNVPKIALAGWIAHEPGNVCPEVFYKLPEKRE